MLIDKRDFQKLMIIHALFNKALECQNFLPDYWWHAIWLIFAWESWKAKNILMLKDLATSLVEVAFQA